MNSSQFNSNLNSLHFPPMQHIFKLRKKCEFSQVVAKIMLIIRHSKQNLCKIILFVKDIYEKNYQKMIYKKFEKYNFHI